ncbi:MAG: hypothetical protein LBM06_09035 [Prevotellaceae bacterium]|nr:hypothetical protein [Prevotellaceae bacterium]
MDLLETSFNKENIDGEEHHVYVYTMCADHPGKYLITPDNVTSSPASVQPFELTIASSNTLWAYVIFLFCVGIGLFGSLQFRKEGKKELADFVIEKRRINLSWKDAVTYFGVPLLFLLIPFLIAGYATFESLRGAPPYLGSLFALVFVVVPLLVALCLGVLRYRSLFFRRKNVTLPHQTILELVEKVQEEHQWTPVYAGYDCYVGRVMNRNGKSCMEQFVYVVFDKGKVWINTFYNLRQRNLFQSFRLAKGCIYTLENSLSQAEVALKKS